MLILENRVISIQILICCHPWQFLLISGSLTITRSKNDTHPKLHHNQRPRQLALGTLSLPILLVTHCSLLRRNGLLKFLQGPASSAAPDHLHLHFLLPPRSLLVTLPPSVPKHASSFLPHHPSLLRGDRASSGRLLQDRGDQAPWVASRMQSLLIQFCTRASSSLARFCTPRLNESQSVARDTLGGPWDLFRGLMRSKLFLPQYQAIICLSHYVHICTNGAKAMLAWYPLARIKTVITHCSGKPCSLHDHDPQ